MAWGLTLLPTKPMIPVLGQVLSAVSYQLHSLRASEPQAECVFSWDGLNRDIINPQSQLGLNDLAERGGGYIVERSSGDILSGLFAECYEADDIESQQRCWDARQSSHRLAAELDLLLLKNATVGFRVSQDVCVDRLPHFNGDIKRQAGLVVAAVVASGFEAVAIFDEMWSYPLVGAYHWKDLEAQIHRSDGRGSRHS